MKTIYVVVLNDGFETYIGKIGSENEVIEYLKELQETERLYQVVAIFPLVEGGRNQIDDFLELDNEDGFPIDLQSIYL
jgi:hypothetical protein